VQWRKDEKLWAACRATQKGIKSTRQNKTRTKQQLARKFNGYNSLKLSVCSGRSTSILNTITKLDSEGSDREIENTDE